MSRLRTFALITSCLVAALPPTVTGQDKLAERFIGAWRLVSVEGHPPGLPNFFGDHPAGILMYDRSGWMAVQIANHGDRKAWQRTGNGFHASRIGRTIEEKAAAVDTYTAYYGTYTIDPRAGTVTHHLEDAILPGSRGIDNIRYYEFQGDGRLLLRVAEDGKGGLFSRDDATYKLLWERIK
jgi:hypothetical protein